MIFRWRSWVRQLGLRRKLMGNIPEPMESMGKYASNLIPVTQLGTQATGRIAFMRGNSKQIRRLLELGLIPGTELSILRIGPLDGPVEIWVRGARLALSRELASNIFVERSQVGDRN